VRRSGLSATDICHLTTSGDTRLVMAFRRQPQRPGRSRESDPGERSPARRGITYALRPLRQACRRCTSSLARSTVRRWLPPLAVSRRPEREAARVPPHALGGWSCRPQFSQGVRGHLARRHPGATLGRRGTRRHVRVDQSARDSPVADQVGPLPGGVDVAPNRDAENACRSGRAPTVPEGRRRLARRRERRGYSLVCLTLVAGDPNFADGNLAVK
jgi:hypothetical protein